MPQRLCIFHYIGGKHNVVEKLLPLMPEHEIYVEVFGGAANLLLNKPRSGVEVYNDIDGELINLFLIVRDRRDEFVDRLRGVPYSRGLYYEWLNGSPPEDPVERAARFYYVMRCSFSGTRDRGWSFKRRAHRHAPDIFAAALEKTGAIAERLKGVYIDCLDFRRCIKNWDEPETFFYLDPPYHGLNYYQFKFTEKDHLDLRRILGETNGKWLLTYNDDPWVREAYSGFHIRELRQLRSASLVRHGGEREHFTNLVITNYPPPGGLKS